MNRLRVVRRGLKARRRAGIPLEEASMTWLAAHCGVSRQMLYLVLDGSERSAPVEEMLLKLFPELPPWPVPWDGAVPLKEWLEG